MNQQHSTKALTAVATRIPILRLYTNIPIKPDIDAALPVSGAVPKLLGAHLEAVAVFLIGGAFGQCEVDWAGADVFKVAHYAVVDNGFGLGGGEEDEDGRDD
jgi:hypothetical protein